MGKQALVAKGDEFILDGEEIRIFSGAIHYFRIPRAYWEHRLQTALDAGLNTVETYVAWNLHEKAPGVFDFSDNLDLVEFIKMAGKMGLHVICRPGPYICSEWEWGGLPYWLLRDPNMRVRVNYKPYQEAVERYFKELLPKLVPLQRCNNGPIIAFQVENEYGDFPDGEIGHLEWLQELMEKYLTELLFLSDGGHTIRHQNMYKNAAAVCKESKDALLKYQMPDEILKTINFKYLNVDKGVADNLTALKQFQPDHPMFVMEFWAGWFDYWGHPRNAYNNQKFETTLREVVKRGASINFYMFHGGTNFGFYSGAISLEKGYYTADVTSYDYDCPISEHGMKNDKWFIIKKVIQEHKKSQTLQSNMDDIKTTFYESISPESYCCLWDSEVSQNFESFEMEKPCSMEMLETKDGLGQGFGYVKYSINLPDNLPDRICLSDLQNSIHGRYRIFAETEEHNILLYNNGLLNKEENEIDEINLHWKSNYHTLSIMVENPGRINFCELNDQRKGLRIDTYLRCIND